MSEARNDGELLAAHLAGREGAFEELAGRHAAMVLGVCRRLLGAGPDAEDAAQATFVLLVRKAAGLRGAADLGAWLHRSARLTSRTALRARRRRARHEKEAAAMRGTGGEAGSDRLWREHADRLDDALDSLPTVHRQALILCYFEGLSQSEAAERLSVPESTLSSRCARGLEKLRDRLGIRERRTGGAALGALIAARAAAEVPDSFVPSVVAAAKGAAASAPILALAEGVLSMMFWTKIKIAALCTLAAGLLAVVTPLAVGAMSGEEKRDANAPGGPAAAGAQPVPVAGLKLTLTAAVAKRFDPVCSEKCAKKQNLANGLKKCATCGRMTNVAHKTCHACSISANTCMVCGKALPAGGTSVGFKAGAGVRLMLTFENVSKEKLRLCDYLLNMRKVKLEIAGLAADSVKRIPTGMEFCLAAIDRNHFPELAPGAKRTYWMRLTGNPPGINQGAFKTCLLKPGAYRVVAVFSNDVDSYFDHRTRKNVKMEGTWKNTVRSQVLELKATGEFKPLPAGGPGLLRAM